MEKTSERNGVLIFVIPRAQKFAVIGDEGIHAKCGDEFWDRLVNAMRDHFVRSNFTDALVEAIEEAGKALWPSIFQERASRKTSCRTRSSKGDLVGGQRLPCASAATTLSSRRDRRLRSTDAGLKQQMEARPPYHKHPLQTTSFWC